MLIRSPCLKQNITRYPARFFKVFQLQSKCYGNANKCLQNTLISKKFNWKVITNPFIAYRQCFSSAYSYRNQHYVLWSYQRTHLSIYLYIDIYINYRHLGYIYYPNPITQETHIQQKLQGIKSASLRNTNTYCTVCHN